MRLSESKEEPEPREYREPEEWMVGEAGALA